MSNAELTLIDRALRAAIRAPSVHNTQPWRFVVASPRIDVWLDRERVLPVADGDAREARLSCGAALLNLRVTLRAEGWGEVVDLLPDPARPDLLATVRIGGTCPVTPELRSLAAAIERRSTNRRPFIARPVSTKLRSALWRAASTEGAHLELLDTPFARESFAMLLRRADHVQEENPVFQRELLDWTTRASARADGVPPTAGGPRPVGTMLLKTRVYPLLAIAERELEQGPLVAVLATAGDTPRDQIRAGQAMQRVLLVATSTGLTTSFLAQPVEVPYTRMAMRALVAGRHPQTVLRIGYGHHTVRTPRRPVTAVATFSTSPDAEVTSSS